MVKLGKACHLPKMERVMTQYNSVSGVRFGLQIATAALFYAAAGYKNVDGLTSAASRIGIAAVIQGVSQKVHAPLGERTKMSWLADGISLGLVAYGMSYTDLAKRTKYLAGAAIFGSQLVISNFKPNTALARIDKIETQEECAEVYAELTQLFDENKETITPEQGMKTCKAFFQKAHPFYSDSWEGSPAEHVLNVYTGFLNELQGWGKVKAQMEYIEVINAARTYNFSIFKSLDNRVLLEDGAQAQFALWLEKTGVPIQHRWSIWSMQTPEHQQVFDTITKYIYGIGEKITFAQKIDLCDQFFVSAKQNYPGKDFNGSPPQKMLVFRERLMHNLEGMELAKAYMTYAEFLHENNCQYPALFDRIIPDIYSTLNENGQAAVDVWMVEKGNDFAATAIQENWRG